MTTERESPLAAVVFERLQGPRCPGCGRDDGSHVVACPLPAYIEGWKKLYADHAERVGDLIFGARDA